MSTTPAAKHPMNCKRLSADNSGVRYKACDASDYISLHYHRSASGTKHDKSLWAVAPPDECHTFCNARLEHWFDQDGNAWSVNEEKDAALGTRGELVAFFENPGNPSGEWHGFPVGGRRGLPTKKQPPDELLAKWRDDDWISYTTYQRILEGRK